jgi:hypothetical protein
MRTATIKLRSIAIAAQELPSSTRRELLRIAIASLAMLAVVYLCILGVMVWNIIERKAVEAQVHNLASEVRVLEESYLADSSKVDINFSQAMGFKEIKATYVRKSSLGLAANRNEI